MGKVGGGGRIRRKVRLVVPVIASRHLEEDAVGHIGRIDFEDVIFAQYGPGRCLGKIGVALIGHEYAVSQNSH